MTTEPGQAAGPIERTEGVWWSLLTPSAVPAALTVIGLNARGGVGDTREKLDHALGVLGIGLVQPGSMALRRIAGVDTGLVVRWSDSRADLFPHGGTAVLRAILERFTRVEIREDRQPDPRAVYPEAKSEIEARVLWALSKAASPLAVDVLLAQPERWGGLDLDGELGVRLASTKLGRLIEPPLVAAIGAPNIGKSSLANALAGRAAVLVADVAGTTRDSVGLMVEFDGLVVRYLDTPGVGLSSESGARRAGSDALDHEASARAVEAVRGADLVLVCQDAAGPLVEIEASEGVPTLRVILRCDRVSDGHQSGLREGVVVTSSVTRAGLRELASEIRRALVPDEVLGDVHPWRFW